MNEFEVQIFAIWPFHCISPKENVSLEGEYVSASEYPSVSGRAVLSGCHRHV